MLVFREGLETILVLAAITASFLGANRVYRKPVAVGGGLALLAAVAPGSRRCGFIGMFGGSGLTVQAATGIPAIIVLLVVMNWFFHTVYWTGWISHHHKRRRGACSAACDGRRADAARLRSARLHLVYREGFEIVIFLQGLRVTFGSSVVLEGVVLGLLFTAAVGVLTFVAASAAAVRAAADHHRRAAASWSCVMVGEEINEMQLAGWIGTTNIDRMHLPGWAGTWFSLFPNVETMVAQFARGRARRRLLPCRPVRPRVAPAPTRSAARPPCRAPAGTARAADQRRAQPAAGVTRCDTTAP